MRPAGSGGRRGRRRGRAPRSRPAHHAGLGPLDLAGDVGRLRRRGRRERGGQQGREHADLAVEQGRRPLALVGPPLAELGVGDGVERAGGDLLADAEAGQAAPQLAGRLAGEGEGEDVAGERRCRGPPARRCDG